MHWGGNVNNKNSKKKKKNKFSGSVDFIFREIAKKDADIINKAIGVIIIVGFICNSLLVLSTLIAGPQNAGYYGPVSSTMNLGLTKSSLTVEIIFSAIFTISFVLLMRAKFAERINRKY